MTTIDPSVIPLGAPTQIRMTRKNWVLAIPLIAILILLGWNVYGAFVRASTNGKVAYFEILSNEALVQLAAAIVGAWFVVHQIAFGAKPHIGYRALPARGSLLEGLRDENLAWSVTFSSDGTGAAIIEQVWYEVAIADRPLVLEASYEEVNDLIKGAGLEEYQDFILWKVSEGAAITPNIERPLFQCTMEARKNRISHLDVVLAYSGRMGDQWVKRIACIPRL